MTQSTPTPVERCIGILLHEILDYMELWDILHTMGVNRLWREQAINHPTYYGDLYLFARGPLANHDLFLARLACSKGRPISVDMEKTPLDLMQEIGNHLVHITDLYVDVSSADSVEAVLQYLCRPAPILHKLHLRFGEPTEGLTAPPTLPADLLAQHAPALSDVSLMGFDLSAGIPPYFFTIKRLSFYSWMNDTSGMFVLPSPFEQCAKLRELHLGNQATLHHYACHAMQHTYWKRMAEVSFTGGEVARQWPAFQLPLYDVLRIRVSHGDRDSVLALASTLLGSLHVTFPTPTRLSFSGGITLQLYTAVLRSMSRSGGHLRVYENFLTEYGCICAFSMPILTDRIARLELELDAWDNFVGLRTFGPFSALDELQLNMKDDTELKRSTALPKLFCPKLQRLVLHAAVPSVNADAAAVAHFARVSLCEVQFPLALELDGVELAGFRSDFPQTFRASVTVRRATAA